MNKVLNSPNFRLLELGETRDHWPNTESGYDSPDVDSLCYIRIRNYYWTATDPGHYCLESGRPPHLTKSLTSNSDKSIYHYPFRVVVFFF